MIRYLAEHRSGISDSISDYLDDFLFLAMLKALCDSLIHQFLELCELIGVPIATDKTEWATTPITFLGILLDGRSMTLALPMEKIDRAVAMLTFLKGKNKATIKQLQTLCGFLNFLC